VLNPHGISQLPHVLLSELTLIDPHASHGHCDRQYAQKTLVFTTLADLCVLGSARSRSASPRQPKLATWGLVSPTETYLAISYHHHAGAKGIDQWRRDMSGNQSDKSDIMPICQETRLSHVKGRVDRKATFAGSASPKLGTWDDHTILSDR